MAISVDYSGATFRIIVPQADLALVAGNLYELDTDAFWYEIKALEAAETGIVFQDMQSHNPSYTVAGVTYAQKIEILNATNSTNTHVYEVFFSPDTQYSVRLAGSNNNIFDLQNAILANAVTQIIPQNSAGLQLISSGSGLSTEQATMLDELWTRFALDTAVPILHEDDRISGGDIDIAITDNLDGTFTEERQ